MSKIIFQIGLLAFCVSFVFFSSQGNDLMQTAQRAFVVFALVVSGIAVLLFVASGLSARKAPEGQHRDAGSSAEQHQADGAPHPAA